MESSSEWPLHVVHVRIDCCNSHGTVLVSKILHHVRLDCFKFMASGVNPSQLTSIRTCASRPFWQTARQRNRDHEKKVMLTPPLSTTPSIDCDNLPDNSDVPETLESSYQTANAITAEARAHCATSERNLCPIDYEPCHSTDQLRAMWAAAGIDSAADMPPPMRFRRVSKKAFIG